MPRKTVSTLLPCLLFVLLALSGCNSSGTGSLNDAKIEPIVIVDTAIVFDERHYDLLPSSELDNLAFKVYWPIDENLSDTEVMLKHLLAINNAINNSLNLSIASFKNKSIILTPTTNTTSNNVEFKQITSEQLQITLPDNTSLANVNLSQKILSFLYASERIKQTGEASAFDKIVTLGLTLHLLENSFENEELYLNVSLSENDLKSALDEVNLTMDDGQPHSDWFEPEGIAAPVGYYLAAQHFIYYPGSHAGNSLTLNSKIFTPWLLKSANPMHKLEFYVRTNDVVNQIEISELSRQASKFIGSYFLEGYNDEKLIALTFDDGPSQYTAQILDVLEKADVQASFFWQGSNLDSYQDDIKRSMLAGHTVANHSWNHPHSAGFSTDKLWQEQVLKTNEQFQRLVGITPRFYRPPYGEISDEQVAFLEEKGIKVMLWSVDTRDWNPTTNSVESIRSETINHQHPEMITLMHDSGGNRQNTVDSLADIIEHYKNQGYRFVNLETLLGISDKG